MQIERSNRACKLCRQRRVKCDKSLPTCRRCQTYGRPCPGYSDQRMFIDQTTRYGHGVQNQQLRNDLAVTAKSSADTIPSITSTSLRDYASSGSSVPGLSNFQTPPTSNDFSTHASPIQYQAPYLDNTNLAAYPNGTPQTDDYWEYFDIDIDTYYASHNNACGFFTDLEELDHTTQPNSIDAPRDEEPKTQAGGLAIPTAELAPLLRLFVEILAPWMDICDKDACFSQSVPHNAALDLLLQFALAAVAAKQAAYYLITQKLPSSAKMFDQVLAAYSERDPKEWFFKAARYYNQGISNLRSVLNRFSSEAASAFGSGRVQDRPSGVNDRLPNVLSAISIFSFYENLDGCFTKSSQHLTGFLALVRNTYSPPSSIEPERPSVLTSSFAGRSAFWYFARKEMFAAYINHTNPAVNPELCLPWLDAGLPIPIFASFDVNDSLYLDITRSYSTSYDVMTMVYILIWLSTRVVKFVAEKDYHSPNEFSGSYNQNTQQNANQKMSDWSRLREHLQCWFTHRPQAIQAYATAKLITSSNGRTLNRTMSFTNSVAAASMQIYHFTQILLLLNQPTEHSWSTSHATRLHTLKQNSEEVEAHSRDICAIASCVPAANIQRQMSHPLQLAGVCFNSAEDRKVIIKLLDDAATETCSAPEEMLQSLLTQWNLHDGVS